MSNDQPRTFQGKNVQEAISKVKAALGENACIIEKRIKKNKNFFKLGGGEEIVEIIASVAPSVVNDVTPRYKPQPKSQPQSLLDQAYGTTNQKSRPKTPYEMYKEASQPAAIDQSQYNDNYAQNEYNEPSPTQPAAAPVEPVSSINVGSENVTEMLMAQMRSEILRLTSIQARGAIPEVGEALLDCYQTLIENEVNANEARTIVEKLQREMPFAILDRENINKHVSEEIARYIHVSGATNMNRTNNRPTIISIVGPNGSGKTTTLTKLAFDAVINQKKSVGLITEDIKRPGAESQLRALTSIMQLPLASVSSPASMADQIHNMSEKDLILIDTGGVSHMDTEGILELNEVLRVASVDETHLLLPVSITERTAMAIIDGYKPLNFNKIIFSKIDASASYGMILNIASKINTDISYVTSGTTCATGLHTADSNKLAKLIATGRIDEITNLENKEQ